jgi:hypothetical protein
VPALETVGLTAVRFQSVLESLLITASPSHTTSDFLQRRHSGARADHGEPPCRSSPIGKLADLARTLASGNFPNHHFRLATRGRSIQMGHIHRDSQDMMADFAEGELYKLLIAIE